MTPEDSRIRIPELSADLALKAGLWLVSVAVLNALVGSPLTDLYVGFSIVGAAFWVGKKAAGLFDDPPAHGRVMLVDARERPYRGEVTRDGEVSFTGPDGRSWTGTVWNGRWTLTDPEGRRWWGRVAREGGVTLHDEEGAELRGTLEPGGE